jgi:hypothetical protein
MDVVWVKPQGAGDGDTVVVVSVPVAGDGLSAAGLAAGVTVSVFCSHAAKRPRLARMQMYFFISWLVEKPILG